MSFQNIGVFFLSVWLLFSQNIHADNIKVLKKNVLHTFVEADPETNHFTRDIFWNWENETFEVFDKVKDKEGIAIDIGGWIGTTSIWLSKNFHHVVTVEPDVVSLELLSKNLKASECDNVTICRQPISNFGESVVFGSRGSVLNQSISFIKDQKTNSTDYSVRSIPFKKLVHDYIFTNKSLNDRRISFIKCDIEGGEEKILEDILYFAYNNNVKVYMSFHYDWWNTKNISDFEYLFKFFKTDCPWPNNILEYIQQHPFASILFEPQGNGKQLVKKNIPVVIIAYNQPTFIKNTVTQIEKYTHDIIIVDNNSSNQDLIDYYNNEFKYTLLRKEANYGYRVYHQDSIQRLVGELYILTDPDLQYNPKLPPDFIKTFIDISQHFGANRVGFALLIQSDSIREDITFRGQRIKEWEASFWSHRLFYNENPSLELYQAPIDTTFCLINNGYNNNLHVRVAGDYTCVHIPWMKGFTSLLKPGEVDSYLQNNNSTSWFK